MIEKDCFSFHWVEAINSNQIQNYRFARLISGLAQSPFILEEALDEHFDNYGFCKSLERLLKN